MSITLYSPIRRLRLEALDHRLRKGGLFDCCMIDANHPDNGAREVTRRAVARPPAGGCVG